MIKKFISMIFFIFLFLSGDTATINKYCESFPNLYEKYCESSNEEIKKYCVMFHNLNEYYCKSDNIDDNYDEDNDNDNDNNLIWQEGEIIDEAYGFKAILYNNEYYFYYEDELIRFPDNVEIKDNRVIAPNWGSHKDEYQYYPISIDYEFGSGPSVLYNFVDKKFIGEKHDYMSCDTYTWNGCRFGKETIVVGDKYDNGDEDTITKYGIMSLKDGHMILENLDEAYYVDKNDNFVVPSGEKINSGSTLYNSKGEVLLKYDNKNIYSMGNGNYIVADGKYLSIFDNRLNPIDLNTLEEKYYYFYSDWPDFILKYCKKNEKQYYQLPETYPIEYKCTKDGYILILIAESDLVEDNDSSFLVYSVDTSTGKLTKLKYEIALH